MASEKDLVFNPKKYAEICAKQDRIAERRAKVNANKYLGKYYDSKVGYGKVWDSVRDYYKSCEW